MKDIKVICCDIDGTLLRDDKTLSDENKCWIKKAVEEKGVKFVIVSGRMLTPLKHFYNEIGITGLSSCLNGTFLVDENDNVLASHTIPCELALKVVEAGEKNNVDLLCVCEDTWFTKSRESFIYKKKLPFYLNDCVAADLKDVVKTKPVNKFVYMSPDKAALDRVYSALYPSYKNGLSFYPGSDFLEVMVGGVSKGSAVEDLINYYKADRSEIMALGDDVNDIEMIQKAGLGVAMGNALDCVKDVANEVTDTNQNDGVAKAIKRFVFNI